MKTPKSMTLSKLKQSELKRFDEKASYLCACRHDGNTYSGKVCEFCYSNNCKKCIKTPIKSVFNSAIEKAYNKGQIYGVDVGAKVGYDLREKEILAGKVEYKKTWKQRYDDHLMAQIHKREDCEECQWLKDNH